MQVQPTGAAIEVRGLSHCYSTPAGELSVLDGAELDVGPGEYVALAAESGAGKTTLLSLIGGLDQIQTGNVHVDGLDLAALHGDELAEYRRTTVGFVFQHFGLLDALTAHENVELACTLTGMDRDERRARADVLLDRVGLSGRAHHRPHQLSGGERQRVAIARALANRPRLVLADEPTGNLDERSSDEVVSLLESVRESDGCTLLLVTHNPSIARRAQRRATMHGGKVGWS